ncbi:MAG: dipeptidase [Candidatus Krumholzibacteria bacterium]|nr:dipeptidase [Candidatus Krumholzibacteria bacterium]
MSEDRKVFFFDAHCDTAMRLVGETPVDLGERLPDGHVDIPRMEKGGVGAQVFACWVDPDLAAGRWMPRTLEAAAAVRAQARRHGDRLEIARSGTDIARIRAGGRIAAVIGVEGGHVLGNDPAAGLVSLYEAGVRCVTLTWTSSNAIANSGDGERLHGGLSTAGREAVREMARLGIVADLSHASDETTLDAIEAAGPVLVSHSGMRSLCDIPRNLGDRVLREVAGAGGIACVNFFPAFLDKSCHTAVFEVWDRYRAERRELAARYGGDPGRADGELLPRYLEQLARIPLPGLPAVADHIEHAASVAGTGHVGIGSDFDGIMLVPPGLEDVSRMQALAAELGRRGWSGEEVAAVAGENLLRLFSEVCG